MNTNFPGFAVIGDCHLRRCIWTHRSQLANDTFVSFAAAVTYCIDQQIDLISVGDLFDEAKPPAEAILFIHQQLDRLEAAGRRLLGIDGNHDASKPSWMIAVNRPGLVYLDKTVIELPGGVIGYGLSYRPSVELDEELAKIPSNVQFLFLHQMSKSVFEREGVWNLYPTKVPAHIRMVFLGDFHKAVAYNLDNGQHHAYTGSTAMQSTAEDTTKSFIDVRVKPEGISYIRIELPTRRFLSVAISSNEELDKFVAEAPAFLDQSKFQDLPESIRIPMLTVKLLGGLDSSRVKAAVGNAAHLWIEPFGHVAITELPSQETLSDPLDEVISEISDPRLGPFVRDLLSTADPRTTIETWASSVAIETNQQAGAPKS